MLYRFEAARGDEVAITDTQNGINLPLEKGPWRPAGTINPQEPPVGHNTERILRTIISEGYYVAPAKGF